jgi:hypothetical protein
MERTSAWARRLVDFFFFSLASCSTKHILRAATQLAHVPIELIAALPTLSTSSVFFSFSRLILRSFDNVCRHRSCPVAEAVRSLLHPLLSLTLCAYSPTIRSSSKAPPRSPLEAASMYLRLPSCSSRRAPPSHRSGLAFSRVHRCPPVIESGRWFTRLQKNGYDDGLHRMWSHQSVESENAVGVASVP